MKELRFVFLILFISSVFAGCANTSSTNANVRRNLPSESSSSSNSSSVMSQSETMPRDKIISSERSEGVGGGGRSEPIAQKISLEQSEQSQSQQIAVDRKIIRDADLTLESNAPEEAQNKIIAIADSKGGFVIESTQSSSDVKATTRDTVTMRVRIPAAKFNESLDEIRKTGSRVIEENIKGQDVTEEFIDVEARLKTQKALEEQFLGIMRQAKSVEDALNVQRELANVRGEIEKIEGRKRFLENQSSLSTIKIRLQTPNAFAGNSSGFFYQLGQAISSGINGALSFVLVLVTALIALLPFFLFIVLPIYLVIRYFVKRNRKQKLASEIARDEIKTE